MADEKRILAQEDLVKIQSLEEPRISPDGQSVAFVRVQIDREKNTYLRNIYVVSLDGTRQMALTRSGKDTQPRWSPDGKHIAFTSARNDKPQMYVATVGQAGDPRQLTNMPNGANAPAWSPDGTQIAFMSGVSADDRAYEDDPENFKKPTEDDEKKKTDPRVVRSLPFRTGTAFNTDKFAQIYVMPFMAEDNEAKPRRLTSIDATHAEPSWSPDGEWIYTSRTDNPQGDEPFRNGRIFRIRVSDGATEQLTDNTHAADRPLVAAGGRWLAFLRFPNENMALRYSLLAVMDIQTGSIRDVNVEPDVNPLTYAWAGDTLFFAAQTHGSVWIYRCDPVTGEIVTTVQGELRAERFDAHPNGTVAYAVFNSETLCELHAQILDGTVTSLTRFNKAFVESTTFASFEGITFESEPGVTLDGWILKPPGFDPAMKYPLVLDIHGGPHIMWSPHYEGEWINWQSVACAGYVVFFANPRGSTGYGNAFQQAIGGQWGPMAYKDIMAGLSVVLERGYIETDRMVVMGGSYGGFMTAWTIAHDHRFKAAIAERGVYNLVSFTGTTDIPSFIPNEFGVDVPENPQLLWENSPVAHAHKIKTPLLIIHSENDFRVPIAEAEQLFALTRRSGLKVEFVRYPREGHELSRAGEPEHRIDRLHRIIKWFDLHVKDMAAG